jgi:uncharacterized membrane protein YsdA (DUF1294 family)
MRHLATRIFAVLVAGNVIVRALDLTAHRLSPLVTTWIGHALSVLALVWIYAIWKSIPASHRGTMSPRRAALTFFIPVYNLYWAVAMNLALCGTLDALSPSAARRRAPWTLLTVALVVSAASAFVSALLTRHGTPNAAFWIGAPLLSGTLWFLYMRACDEARDAVDASTMTLGRPTMAHVQRVPGAGLRSAIGVYVLILFALACWQFLTPTPPGPRREGTGARHERERVAGTAKEKAETERPRRESNLRPTV